MDRLPLFPLGTVLVPGALLPLHVFEPRYRQLVRTCLAGDGRFGIVLIEQGSEVGGGDRRSGFGTLARIVEVDEYPDGRFFVGVVGEERIRIERWLPDDPHPWAACTSWPDPEPAADLTMRLVEVGELLAEVHEVRRLLGAPTVPTLADPGEHSDSVSSLRLVAASPLGPLDLQALLGAPTVAERLDLLQNLLADHLTVCRALLEGE